MKYYYQLFSPNRKSVYDQTIPIVAAQLLFTVGVTCALAFELPSEPIYKITQKLRNNLYGIKDDDDETTTAAAEGMSSEEDSATDAGDGDDHSRRRIDSNNKRLQYINSNQLNYYDSMNKHSYYYSADNSNKHYHKPLSSNYYFSDKSDNYYNNYSHNKSDKSSNQSPLYVTPSPLNATKSSVWTSVIKT